MIKGENKVVGKRVFFSSDYHWYLGHKNILKYCDRPFKDTREMDEIIVLRYNEVVKPEDLNTLGRRKMLEMFNNLGE